MNPSGLKREKEASWKRTAAYAAALSMLFLLATFYPAWKNLMTAYSGHQVFRSIFSQWSAVSPLVGPVAVYAIVLVILHLAVGAAATVLAYLSRKAFPESNATRQSLMLLWFLGLAMLAVMTSAGLYPRSHLGSYYHGVAALSIGPIKLFHAALMIGAAIALLVVVRAMTQARIAPLRAHPIAPALLAMGGCAAVIALWPAGGDTSAAQSRGNRDPHIVIVGFDSLRTDLLARFSGLGPAVHLDAELSGALLFKDATTPLARTFPSWVSILTGAHPRTTGASFNLIGRDRVASYPTLADILRSRGYRTVFATDESRFANIDASYGFDQVITPRIGATDFILGTVNDLPLANLLANTRLGAYLFPNTYANRAAASRYEPDVFVDRLRRELDFRTPTVLVVHLTAPHWPYHDASSDRNAEHGDARTSFDQYLAGVRTADRQFRDILSLLRRSHALDNALMWLITDHGEGFGRPGDRLIAKESGGAISASAHGHGTSVLSPVQFQVLMAIKGFGAAAARVPAGESSLPVTLEDLTPTTLDLLDMQAQATRPFDGRSLKGIVTGDPSAQAEFASRIRFTETDFNLPRMLAGEVNPGWLAMSGAEYYSIDPKSGWIELRADRLGELMNLKERAAIAGNLIMASVPAMEGQALYVVADRMSGDHRILGVPPLEGPEKELWDALHERFPDELAPMKRAAHTERSAAGSMTRVSEGI